MQRATPFEKNVASDDSKEHSFYIDLFIEIPHVYFKVQLVNRETWVRPETRDLPDQMVPREFRVHLA